MVILASFGTYVTFLFIRICLLTPLAQVAVSKHLGLQALRLADSIVLPLNTTHYALELEAYLQK